MTESLESNLATKEITRLRNESTLLHESIFYNLPKYYDMAFERDVSAEIAFYKHCFETYSDVHVKRILEPACGTGIFVVNLPDHAFDVLGYDLSKEMVEYTKARIMQLGLQAHADAVVGDMKDAVFTPPFDAAIICINSLGYLTRDQDIVAHFHAMNTSLVENGLYIIEIGCQCDDINAEARADQTWCVSREGTKIQLTWNPNRYDVEHRIRHVDFTMVVEDNGRQIEVTEAHELRLWVFEEFVQYANAGGFDLVASYNQAFQQVDYKSKINGELGVLYHVLKKRTP